MRLKVITKERGGGRGGHRPIVNFALWMKLKVLSRCFFTCHLHPPNLLEDFVAHQSHPDKSSKDEELDKWMIYCNTQWENGEYYTLNAR